MMAAARLPCAVEFDALLAELAVLKYGDPPGRTARLHRRMGYTSPNLFYEAMVAALVGPDSDWLDVGGGPSPFPHNPRAARLLADRCRRLVAVDPGENLPRNSFAYEAVASTIEAYRTARQFDLVTLRMVAEHLADPAAALAAIARLLRPGGRAVIYTVDRRSPSCLVNRMLVPPLRRAVMRGFGGAAGDVFPTFYRLNRRATLRAQAAANGLDEVCFRRIDDCRASQPWPLVHGVELRWRRIWRRIGLAYPESCLLAVFERRA